MSKKVHKAPSVYRPARIINEVDKAISDLVKKGKYKNYNAALNGELKKKLKVAGKKFQTLKELQPGDKFKLAGPRAYREYIVVDNCVRQRNKTHQIRKCTIIASGQTVYPSCKTKIIKL